MILETADGGEPEHTFSNLDTGLGRVGTHVYVMRIAYGTLI